MAHKFPNPFEAGDRESRIKRLATRIARRRRGLDTKKIGDLPVSELVIVNPSEQDIEEATRIERESDDVRPEISVPQPNFTRTDLTATEKNILNQNIFHIAGDLMQDVEAADAGSYGNFFVADDSWQVISITEVHRVVGTGGTVQVEKLTSGTAKGSGLNLLATAFSLTASVNVPRFGTLTTTKADLILRRGDRLGSKTAALAGTPEDVQITVILKKL